MKMMEDDLEVMNLEYDLICDFIKLRKELGLIPKLIVIALTLSTGLINKITPHITVIILVINDRIKYGSSFM